MHEGEEDKPNTRRQKWREGEAHATITIPVVWQNDGDEREQRNGREALRSWVERDTREESVVARGEQQRWSRALN